MKELLDKIMALSVSDKVAIASLIIAVIGTYYTYKSWDISKKESESAANSERLAELALIEKRDLQYNAEIAKSFIEYEYRLSNFILGIKDIRDFVYYNDIPPPPDNFNEKVKTLQSAINDLQKKSEQARDEFEKKLKEGSLYMSDKKIASIGNITSKLQQLRVEANGLWFFPDISENNKKHYDNLIKKYNEYRKERKKLAAVFS